MALTPNLGMIDPASVSFEEILDDLVKFAQNKPENLRWQDWLKSSNGVIVAEWIAGLGAFRAYHEIMRVRESQLDNAQLPSSVFNLAFNRGLLVPPSLAAEMTLTISVTNLKSVDIGDFVAQLGTYELYSLEAKTLNGTGNTLRCVVGHLETWEDDISGLKAFQTFTYTVTDQFFAQQLETFAIDGEPVTLLTDPDYLNDIHNDFMLRRVMPNQAKIYSGNNIIGTYKASARKLTYSVLTYDRDVNTALVQTPRLLIDGRIDDYAIIIQPSFDPDKEEVREIARFYPIDGRVVQDNDYAVMLRKNFGGILVDVYSYNTDPDQQVYILKDVNFGPDGSDQEAEYMARIEKLINVKRAMGMHVLYHLKNKSEGKSFVGAVEVPKDIYTNDLVAAVNTYLQTYLYRFQRKATSFGTFNKTPQLPPVLTTNKVAIDLSAKFGVRFYPVQGQEVTLPLDPTDFLNEFYINVGSF